MAAHIAQSSFTKLRKLYDLPSLEARGEMHALLPRQLCRATQCTHAARNCALRHQHTARSMEAAPAV